MTFQKALVFGLALLIPQTAFSAQGSLDRLPATRDHAAPLQTMVPEPANGGVPLWILQQARLDTPSPQASTIRPNAKIKSIAIGRQLKPAFSLSQAQNCETRLRAMGVRFTVHAPLGKGRYCGWKRPLQITRLPDDVKVIGNLRLRCETALALAQWTRGVVVPEARRHLDARVTAMDIGSSYACRRRNNKRSGKLSEHAFANAIDVMAIHLSGQKVMNIRWQKGNGRKAFQKSIRKQSCKYFNTVLGPGSDRHHADHFHLDLALHKGGGKYCK